MIVGGQVEATACQETYFRIGCINVIRNIDTDWSFIQTYIVVIYYLRLWQVKVNLWKSMVVRMIYLLTTSIELEDWRMRIAVVEERADCVGFDRVTFVRRFIISYVLLST